MRQFNRRFAIAVFAVCLFTGGIAQAGLPMWSRRPQAPYPPETYAPETRHYTVIDPVVVSRPQTSREFGQNVPPPGQVLWRQKVQPAPTYPWGWFGARRHWHNFEHGRFYGDARDWGYIRGD